MKNKFSTAEKVVGGLFTLLVDTIAAGLDFIPGIGWIMATTIQSATSFATTLWLKSKGGEKATKIERQIIKQISNTLPWVPTCFASFLIEAIIHNKTMNMEKEAPDNISGRIGKASKNFKKAA